MTLSIQYYKANQDIWTKKEVILPGQSLEELCKNMTTNWNARIYVDNELALTLYRTSSFQGDLTKITIPSASKLTDNPPASKLTDKQPSSLLDDSLFPVFIFIIFLNCYNIMK